MRKVLIVDDDPDVCAMLSEILAAEDLEIVQAGDGRSALEAVAREAPTLVVLDINLPALDGIEVLRRIKQASPEVPVIMLTALGDLRTAVETMRLGAYDYVTKPFDAYAFVVQVRRALERQALLREVESLRGQLVAGGALRALLGPSRQIQEVVERVRQVAGSPLTVLVQGETGTGKEVVAHALHQESARRDAPFVALDCGAIPETLIESELFGYEKGAFSGAERRKEGLFPLAAGGTLFMDEIGNLPLALQPKLLRALQERQVWPLGAKAPVATDVRIIAASNMDLDEEVRAGRFRADLFYRLNEFSISVPPLRVRPEDTVLLARRFLEEAAIELKRPVRGFSPEALTLLRRHPWPGNVRELRNVVRRAVLLARDVVTAEHLEGFGDPGAAADAASPADDASPAPSLREAREQGAAAAEQRAIRWALLEARGNKSEAARLLKTDFKTLHVKMREYGISLTDRVPS